GPLASWKRVALPDLWTRLRWALAISAVTALVAPLAFGRWSPGVAFGLWLALWIAAATLAHALQRFSNASQRGFAAKIAAQPLGWYGMMLAHLGVAAFIVGVTLVKSFEAERELRMAPGDRAAVAGYEFTFKGTREIAGPNYTATQGEFEVRREGASRAIVMLPE